MGEVSGLFFFCRFTFSIALPTALSNKFSLTFASFYPPALLTIPPIHPNSTHHSKFHFKVYLLSKLTLYTFTHITLPTQAITPNSDLAFILLLTYLCMRHYFSIRYTPFDIKSHVPHYFLHSRVVIFYKERKPLHGMGPVKLCEST